MDVVFWAFGDIVIDHMTHMGDVNSPRRNICGHHNAIGSMAKGMNHLFPFSLGQTSVDGIRRLALIVELFCKAIRPPLRPHKDDGRPISDAERLKKVGEFFPQGGVNFLLGHLHRRGTDGSNGNALWIR